MANLAQSAHTSRLQAAQSSALASTSSHRNSGLFLNKIEEGRNGEPATNNFFGILEQSKQAECRHMVQRSEQIQQRLKRLMNQNIDFTKAYEKYCGQDELQKSLNKELLEFAGITLIN